MGKKKWMKTETKWLIFGSIYFILPMIFSKYTPILINVLWGVFAIPVIIFTMLGIARNKYSGGC